MNEQEILAAMQLGVRYQQIGKLQEAEHIYRQVLEINPNHADALNLLGIIALESNCAESAETLIRRAIEVSPKTAVFYENLGRVLLSNGRRAEAIPLYNKAISLNPNSPSAYNDLSCALLEDGKLKEAEKASRLAIRYGSNLAKAYYNLGNALQAQRRLKEAKESYKTAIKLDPTFAEAFLNLGNVYNSNEQFDEAYEVCQRAIDLNPNFAAAHVNQGFIQLVKGNFHDGLAKLEWRWRLIRNHPQIDIKPRWDGSPLKGRKLLLREEQGLGDTIHFLRYIDLVKEKTRPDSGTIIFRCKPCFKRLLLNYTGIDQLITEEDDLPDFDVQAPLMSLPFILGTTLETIPSRVPYLKADEELVTHWQRRLSLSEQGLKIGICWQGNPKNGKDHQRSFPLSHFSRLTSIEGIKFISLQKGAGSEQIGRVNKRLRERIVRVEEMESPEWDFMDTAALMMNLDLVITTDTAVAHLAGALGIPVWTLIYFAPDWRWLLHRTDSPWYPTMRLFRQKRYGDWDEVFKDIHMALQNFIKHR
jgi:tetratricopeptide (TPR) repeat protein